MSELKEKFKRHIPWEQFWLRISGIGIGLVVSVYVIINFNEWGVFKSLGLLVVAIAWTIFNIWSLKRNWNKI